jgi:hypothetical protein
MNELHDFDADDDIRGLWNRQRARLPRFDAAHRETVLAAVTDVLAAEPALPARRPASLFLAPVAAAIMVALPWWLAVVALPPLARAATSGPTAVSLAARAEAVGLALPADSEGQLAAVGRPVDSGAARSASGRAVLRSIDAHTVLDAPHFTLGENF